MDTIKETWYYKYSEVIGVLIILPQIIISAWEFIRNGFAQSPLLIAIIIFQILEIIILYFVIYEMKCKLSLIESLENNDRASLISAIQMYLNKDKYNNAFQITRAVLYVSVVEKDHNYEKDELCDLKFKWHLEGKATSSDKSGRLFFRLSTISAASFSSLNFEAKQIINKGGNMTSEMRLEPDNRQIQDKGNMFIIPLMFKSSLEKNDVFTVEVTYTCPSCFFQAQDWLIIAPFNFSSKPLERFEINILCDGKIITEKDYSVRLYKLLLKSHKLREFEDASSFEIANNVFTSGEVKVDQKYIYIAEINRHDEK